MAACTFAFLSFDDLTPIPTMTDQAGGALLGCTYTFAADARPLSLPVGDAALPATDTTGPVTVLARPLDLGGRSFAPGARVEMDCVVITEAGDPLYLLRLDGQNLGLAGPRLPQPGQAITTLGARDLKAAAALLGFDGVLAGSMVETPEGSRPIESLAVGDMVFTTDHGPRPIRRAPFIRLSVPELIAHPQLRPIVVEAGTLGNQRALLVSPRQRLLTSGWRAELVFGRREAMVPAGALVDGSTVRRAPLTGPVSYYRPVFDAAERVICEGTVTECPRPGMGPSDDAGPFDSLFPGPETPAAAASPGTTSQTPLRPYQARRLRDH